MLKARIAGVFYLITFIAGVTALVSVSGRFVASLVSTASYLAVTLLFYGLFKPVNRGLSLLATLFSLAGLTLGLMKMFGVVSIDISPLVLFGGYCVLIGYLIFTSTYLPRWLGALMVFGGVGWLTFASPHLARALSPYNLVPGMLAEGVLTLWLLAVGADSAKWRQRVDAGAAASPGVRG